MYVYHFIAISIKVACIDCELWQTAVHAWFEYDYSVKIGLRNIRNAQINTEKRYFAIGFEQEIRNIPNIGATANECVHGFNKKSNILEHGWKVFGSVVLVDRYLHIVHCICTAI